MAKTMKIIRIACETGFRAQLDDIDDFQGNLKELSAESFDSLRKEIIETGIAFAAHVWKDPKDKRWKCCDGHQRRRVIEHLVTKENYRIDGGKGLPIVPVFAKSLKEAKRRVLQGTAQYGKMTGDGLYQFMAEAEMTLADVAASFRFPDIDMDAYRVEYFDDPKLETSTIAGEQRQIFSNEEIIEDAFKHFREAGFPYAALKPFELMQELNRLCNVDREDCVRSTIGYRIPDTYHRHRVHAAANGMMSPADGFQDDVRLRKALRFDLEAGKIKRSGINFINLVNGVQACSNFRPAFAKMLYEMYAKPGAKVFDSSTGYGGRLTGFIASHCAEYFGTDPNQQTFLANTELAKDLARGKKVHLFNQPIEDLDISSFEGKLDFAFTSPPYFTKELYSKDANQSCVRYPEYQDWIDGFLAKMLAANWAALKRGSFCVINIEDVQIKGKKYALVQPTIDLGNAVGFKFMKLDKFALPTTTRVVDGSKVCEEQSESMIVFKKP